MTRLDKLRQLSPTERGMLLQAMLILPVIHAGLALVGYYRLQRSIEKLIRLRESVQIQTEAEVLGEAWAISRVVGIAAGHGLYRATCLRRSLVVWWFLRERGIRSEICFGVRKDGERLEAHAWVEHSGVVVNDSVEVVERFQTLRGVLPPVKQGL